MFELLAAFVSVTGLSFYLLWNDLVELWRDRRLGKRLSGTLSSLQGHRIEIAIDRLGEPSEVLEGTSGRRLYIWNSHKAPRLPQDKGFVVVSLTVNESGTITQSSWKA
jgi:hypothetical protein